MEHVLPPRPSGALTAIQANPTADVVFTAHTGLGLAAIRGRSGETFRLVGPCRQECGWCPELTSPRQETSSPAG